ncbi:hypothetical protein KSP40_PGU021826 [Platanthera guangdongensis]|uniref:Uncharacterized protein n=1 Tax=Platanthera guangdongensis TaxID=2320717 RepID=A0ABR2LS27_9ASPA
MPGETFSFSHLLEMGCCGCFGFLKKSSHRPIFSIRGLGSQFPQDFLVPEASEDGDGILYSGVCDGSTWQRAKKSEEILVARAQSGWICREVPVKETLKVTLSEALVGWEVRLPFPQERWETEAPQTVLEWAVMVHRMWESKETAVGLHLPPHESLYLSHRDGATSPTEYSHN